MRRVIIAALCLLLLTTAVLADSGVNSVMTTASVNVDGTAQVTVTATFRVEDTTDLYFPVGTDVSDVTVNGAAARLKTVDGTDCVYMTGLYGEFTVTVHYIQNHALTYDKAGKPVLSLPLLSGFSLPVESAKFSVTLPCAFDGVPAFTSGYHQDEIENSLTYEISGTTITAEITAPLKDRETLTLSLALPADQFPEQETAESPMKTGWRILLGGAAVCLLYWVLTMRFLPPWRPRRMLPPAEFTAGEVGSRLTGVEADLTLMVVSWAQLGYLMIRPESRGRVLLYKKMEMGNERSDFEIRSFRALFGKRNVVEATGVRYTRLWEDTAARTPVNRGDFKRTTGNPALLRLLCVGVGALTGIVLGSTLVSSGLRVLWMVLFAILYAACAWMIQMSCRYLLSSERMNQIWGLGCCAVQFVPAVLCAQPLVGVFAAVFQVVFGILGAFGGQRTLSGRQAMADILGLRRHMRSLRKSELVRIMRGNPEYYYSLVPFALALGMDRKLAAQFGKMRMPDCPWLALEGGSALTAEQWRQALRRTVKAMNEGRQKLPWEQIFRK
ncbi:MAG: DUF2207 family protein [Faecousia sp.]